MKFFIVDAFGNKAFSGNTAGVVLIDKENDFPKDEVMLNIAKELRYSETAFIKRIDDTTFNTRYFTPTNEVELCGHATIAAFKVLLSEKIIDCGKFINKTINKDLEVVVNEEEIKEIYDAIGLDYEKEKNPYCTINPYIVSTGLQEIFVNVFNLDKLNALEVDLEKIKNISKKHNVIGLHVYTLMAVDMKVHARNFAPLYGIDEESASGTSNASLAHLLLNIDMALTDTQMEIIQGEKMGKASIIKVKNTKDENGVSKVIVGLDAYILAKGELNIK